MTLSQLPEKHQHYRLEGEAVLCETCGADMMDISSMVVREEPLFIPAHIEKTAFHQHAYKCHACEKETETTVIKKAPVPRPLINNSFGSPTMVAQTMVEKYVKKVPAYLARERMESLWFSIRSSKDYQLASFNNRVCISTSL